ncbi:tonsoku-like protein [Culex pipiens pallens]|uniref:tonsoku-like protein n=1 Tax=Culex pipiens pallens TaxID=42434 RepID=UPI001953F256|nr:tonsoku-like protein [Culex pipiens pallens]
MGSETDMEEQRLLRRKKTASEAGNQQLLVEACRKLGEMYNEQGEHQKARIEYKLVAKSYQKLKMQMEVGRAYRMVGEQLNMLGEFQKALEYDRKYLDIAKQEKNYVEVQRAYVTIGRTFLMKGQSCEKLEQAMEPLLEAEKAFEKSLNLSRQLKCIGRLELVDMEVRSLLNLGVAKEHQGDLEQAAEYMLKATKLAENNDLAELLHQCYTTSALLFDSKQKNHARALKALSDALEVASRLHNKATKMCETLIAKADIQIKTGDFQSARQTLKQAYKLRTPVATDAENIEQQLKVLVVICRVEDELIMARSGDYKRKKQLYERMGDGACKLENYSKAIDYYQKMLECAQLAGEADRDLIPIYVSLYQTYKDNEQYDDALVYLWQEYALIEEDPEEAYKTLSNIADVFEAQKKPWNEVEEIYQRARTQAKKLKSVSKERVAIKRCVAMLKRQGMKMMAERLEKEATGMGMDLADSEDSDALNETATSIENAINSLDIGGFVDLEALSSSDDERSKDKTPDGKSTRKRGTIFKVKKNNKGESQLHQACIDGNLVLVQKLLDQGHPVNVRDNAGWLPLHEACIHGHKEIVDLLLDRGAYMNDKGGTSCDGITPLYDACSNGNLEVVELLLDRGANCTQRTDSGDTTLNVLQVWFEEVQRKLSPEIVSHYNTICHRIQGYFDVAGVKPDESATVPAAIQSICLSSDSENDEARPVRPTVRISVKKAPKRRPLAEVHSNSYVLSSDSEPEELVRPRASKPGLLDYRTAIEAVRKRTNAQLLPLKDPNPTPPKRTAHMRREEVGDDWLVANVNPTTKRQKFPSDKDYSEPSAKSSRRTLPVASSNDSNRVPQQSAPSLASKPRQQCSTGSNRDQEAGSSVCSRSVGSTGSSSKESVASSSGDKGLSGTTTAPSLMLPASMVRVLVDGDHVDVHYEQDQQTGLSVGWLAEEVANRYGIKHGKRPLLKLMRSDNSLCVDSEPLTTVLKNTGPVIKSYVIEYTSLRGDQFYDDSCRLRGLEPFTALTSALNLMENTGKLVLKRDFFAGNARHFDLLFQAVGCQGSARELDVSMNQLTDAELQGFIEKLPVLKKLERLNLATNSLTQKSIFNMATVLASLPDGLIYMAELDLSRCALLDQSMPQLASICQRMPQLRVLRLASTLITNLAYGKPQLEVSRLQVLDVSDNTLNLKSIEYMFANLDTCILTELNGRKLGLLSEFKPKLTVAIQTKEFDMLSTLDLSQCGLTDDELSTLLVPLRSSAVKLKLLDVSFNRLLTKTSFVEVFRTLNTHSLEMVRFAENPLVLKNLSEQMVDDIQYDRDGCYPYAVDFMRPLRLTESEANTLLKKLSDFWEQLWKDRGAVSMSKSTVLLRQKH